MLLRRDRVVLGEVLDDALGGAARAGLVVEPVELFLLPDVRQVVQWTFMGIALLLTVITGLDYIRKARQVRAFGQLRDEAGLPRPPR